MLMRTPWKETGQARYQRTFRGRAVRLAISARANARKFGIDCDLDAEWIEERLRAGCAQTKLPFEMKAGAEERTGYHRMGAMSPSLDKINPRGGYTKDNVQVVCWIYNRSKGANTDETVLEFAKALIRAHGGSHL
jgi:hypothetical protein